MNSTKIKQKQIDSKYRRHNHISFLNVSTETNHTKNILITFEVKKDDEKFLQNFGRKT